LFDEDVVLELAVEPETARTTYGCPVPSAPPLSSAGPLGEAAPLGAVSE
jgi:hypothetical protein